MPAPSTDRSRGGDRVSRYPYGVPSARKERLLHELGPGADAFGALLAVCAACLTMIAVGLASVDPVSEAATLPVRLAERVRQPNGESAPVRRDTTSITALGTRRARSANRRAARSSRT